MRPYVIASLLVAAVAAGPASAGRRAADDTKGNLVDEGRLALAVKAALLERLGESALQVGVSANGPRVLLSGVVPELTAIEAAEAIAAGVPGVVLVDVRLEAALNAVRAELVRDLPDALLEARVKEALLAALGPRSFRLNVEAVGGAISLVGAVATDADRARAEQLARAIDGVRVVANQLTIEKALRKSLLY